MYFSILFQMYTKNNHPQNTIQILEILFIGHCVIVGHQPNIFQIFYNNLIFSYYCTQSHPLTIGPVVSPPPRNSTCTTYFSLENMNKYYFPKKYFQCVTCDNLSFDLWANAEFARDFFLEMCCNTVTQLREKYVFIYKNCTTE